MFFEVAVEKMFQYELCAKSKHLETSVAFFLFTFVESRFLFFLDRCNRAEEGKKEGRSRVDAKISKRESCCFCGR